MPFNCIKDTRFRYYYRGSNFGITILENTLLIIASCPSTIIKDVLGKGSFVYRILFIKNNYKNDSCVFFKDKIILMQFLDFYRQFRANMPENN